GPQRDLRVRARRREHQHHLDAGIVEERLLGRHSGDAEALLEGTAPLLAGAVTGDDPDPPCQFAERLDMRLRRHPQPDDPDADSPRFLHPDSPLQCRPVRPVSRPRRRPGVTLAGRPRSRHPLRYCTLDPAPAGESAAAATIAPTLRLQGHWVLANLEAIDRDLGRALGGRAIGGAPSFEPPAVTTLRVDG